MSTNELPTYHFDGYTLRPAMQMDALLAMEWTAADPDHAWEAGFPDYWIEQKKGINSYVLEDEYGVVFFFKMVRVKIPCVNCGSTGEYREFPDFEFLNHSCKFRHEMVKNREGIEINLQFDVRNWIPATDRVMWALIAGMDWLAKALPMNGIDTVYFHSKSPRLITFAEKRLGFVRDGERWKREIAPVEAVANSIKGK